MRYLTVEEVAAINISFVGDGMLLDAGLLASAVGRPEQTVFGEEAYGSLFAGRTYTQTPDPYPA